ncbi:Pre-mRNA-splicing factor 38B [Madurella fahalii]|uniref:Pre-mRNA-splicing factor 38B n=1 Tax=Madurella fahalii TaxID=1157608 RepID=A0ABQ0G2X0_9PEZI
MDRNRAQHEMLTDDAVATLLAKEASDASIKYSSMGLEAFKSTKPSNKAKPNTRFLGRIIKETTSHNAALLAKEAAEAQARLDDLTELEEKKRRKLNPSASDIRRRQLGDISSILQGRKQSKGTDRSDRSRAQEGGRDRDQARERDHRRRRQDRDGGKDERRRRSARSSSPSRKDRRYRDRSPLSDTDGDERPRHSRSQRRPSDKSHDLFGRESSRRKRYGRLAEDDEWGSRTPPQEDLVDGSFSSHSKHGRLANKGDDSDPLEELIGPAPPPKAPVRTRGRGAIKGAAAMDSRFSDGYDPASDVQMEPAETEDWDEAVEAYRDRLKWKQQGAERLRAAGFTDEQVKKWEKGGEKDIDDVQWSKAGERREWDRGKDNIEL